MKLLFVCTSSYVFGAEAITLNLMKGLREHGHEVRAITSLRQWSDADFHERLRVAGIPFIELPLGYLSPSLSWKPLAWTLNAALRLPALWWRYARFVREFQPTVIVLTSFRQVVALWPLLAAERALLHLQSSVTPTAKNRRLWRWLDRRLRGYIACSDFIERNLQAVGLAPRKIAVIKSGIVIDPACPPFGAARVAGAPPVIGIAGQIGAWKGHDDLVEAAALLAQQGLDFRVHIFGRGAANYIAQLTAKIAALGLTERVEWLGFQTDPQQIFGALDICAVPSRFEDPYPTVALEAALYGLPVVASDRGGLPEIVQEGQTGLIVPAEDPAQLAEKLRLLLLDGELRRRYGAAARARALAVFSHEWMTGEFEALCQRLAQGLDPGQHNPQKELKSAAIEAA